MSAGWLNVQEFTSDINFIFAIGIMPCNSNDHQ